MVFMLVSPPPDGTANDNHEVLAQAFTSLGCDVTNASHEALMLVDDSLSVRTPRPLPLAALI